MAVRRYILLPLTIALCLCAGQGWGATIYLDAAPGNDCEGNYSVANRDCTGSAISYDTLQECITNAADGDTISVRAGTYVISGNIDNSGDDSAARESLTITGYDQNASQAIFDYGGGNYRLYFEGYYARNPSLSYLTFQNATITSGNYGLVYANDLTGVDFNNLIFRYNNTGGAAGNPKSAGLSLRQAEGSVSNCTFEYNNATSHYSCFLYLYSTSSKGTVSVENCTFRHNTLAATGEPGYTYPESGSIFVRSFGNATAQTLSFSNNDFHDNTIYSQQGAAAYQVLGATCNISIIGDHIYNNVAPGPGDYDSSNGGTPAGFRISELGTADYIPTFSMTNCTIENNNATDKHPSSVCRVEDSYATFNFTGLTVQNNRAVALTGVATGMRLMADSAPQILTNFSKCKFINNYASTGGDDPAQSVGHLVMNEGNHTISQCLFIDGTGINGTEITSGGIGIAHGTSGVCSVAITHTTFTGNTATGAGNPGNDIALKDTSNASTEHVLSMTNVAFTDILEDSIRWNDYYATTNTTCLWGASGIDSIGKPLSGFAGIDAGTDVGLTTDIIGTTVPLDGDGDGTATPDIGAYEYVRTAVADAARKAFQQFRSWRGGWSGSW